MMAIRASASICLAAALLSAPALVSGVPLNSTSDGSWAVGRATCPSGPGPDGMSIYTGSCGKGTGLSNHMVAAAQTMGGYDYGLTDQCGKCFEVLCVDGKQRGTPSSVLGPWKARDRAHAPSASVPPANNPAAAEGRSRGMSDGISLPQGCLEAGRRSVIVQITDSCPCNHPNTGNKRWCCGDALHLDLSYAAFDAIAQRDRGVVDLKVRPADCGKWGQQIKYDADPSGK